MDSVLGRLTERIKNSFRRVEQLDQTKAGHISHIAEERYSVKAGHASIIAEDDVKIVIAGEEWVGSHRII
jgi:hypothetical protein